MIIRLKINASSLMKSLKIQKVQWKVAPPAERWMRRKIRKKKSKAKFLLARESIRKKKRKRFRIKNGRKQKKKTCMIIT